MAARARLFPLTTLAVALVLAAAVMVPAAAPQGAPAPPPALQGAPTAPSAARPGRHGLSAQLIEQCLEVARDVDPALAERLEAIRRERPGPELAAALRDARYLRNLARLKDEDPKLYDAKVKELRLDAKIDRLLEQIAEARRSGSEGAEELETQLHGLVQQQVAFSLVARGMYLRRLNDQLKTLRDQLAHDLGHFDQAVDERMKVLLRELEEE
jgi:hypothetical protein